MALDTLSEGRDYHQTLAFLSAVPNFHWVGNVEGVKWLETFPGTCVCLLRNLDQRRASTLH